MYRKYYSYSDMPVPVGDNMPKKQEEAKVDSVKKPITTKKLIQNDDLILIAVFLLLIMNDCEDRLLLLIVGAIFFMN